MFTVHNVEYCTCAGLSEPSLAAYVRPLVKSVYQKKKKYFSYFKTKTCVVGTQKNRLNETVHLTPKSYAKNYG